MKNRLVVLQTQRELADGKQNTIDAAAGQVVDRELYEMTRKHQAEMKEIREEIIGALEERDKDMRRELEWEVRKLQEQVRIEKDSKRIEAGATERQRAEAVHKRQLADLTSRLQDRANASAAFRARLEREIKKSQDFLATPVLSLPTPYAHVLFSLATHDD